MTFDLEWAELPDDIAHRKQQAWQEWDAIDTQLQDPAHPLGPEEQAELERRHRAAWKQYWHADGARYHLSNRQMGDAITVMEHAGMARRVPTPPFPKLADYGASTAEYGAPPPMRWTAASGPFPGGTSGWTTWTPHEATAASASTNPAASQHP